MLHGEMRIGECIIRQTVQHMYDNNRIKRKEANERKHRFEIRIKKLFCNISGKASSSFKIEVIHNKVQIGTNSTNPS